jgi:hypothetical protein
VLPPLDPVELPMTPELLELEDALDPDPSPDPESDDASAS